MVVFRYFLLILILDVFLEQHIHVVNCFAQNCEIDAGTQILDCSNRNLTKVPEDVFSLEYAKIKLGNNSFVCDCAISWFLDGIQNSKNSDRIIDLKTLKCGSPDRLRSMSLVQLNREDVCSLSKLLTYVTAANILTTSNPGNPDPCLPNGDPKCNPDTETCSKDGKCNCKQGFSRKAETDQCEVFDDACLGKNNCSVHAQCINEIGSYKCVCNSGYIGNGRQCKDKNECKNRVSNQCHKYALCINNDGGYTCRCRKGFEQHKEGRVCIRKHNISVKAFVLGGLLVAAPLVTFVALCVFICRRRLRTQMLERQAAYSPESPPNDDVMPPDNQQLILGADSYFEESIPMKGLPPAHSEWNEWPSYDEARESDSD